MLPTRFNPPALIAAPGLNLTAVTRSVANRLVRP
jgi:hypothetical protein